MGEMLYPGDDPDNGHENPHHDHDGGQPVHPGEKLVEPMVVVRLVESMAFVYRLP